MLYTQLSSDCIFVSARPMIGNSCSRRSSSVIRLSKLLLLPSIFKKREPPCFSRQLPKAELNSFMEYKLQCSRIDDILRIRGSLSLSSSSTITLKGL